MNLKDQVEFKSYKFTVTEIDSMRNLVHLKPDLLPFRQRFREGEHLQDTEIEYQIVELYPAEMVIKPLGFVKSKEERFKSKVKGMKTK